MSSQPVTDAQYRQLLGLRSQLRRFLRWSADQARHHDLTPNQHQLLLAVRGHDDPRGPTIRDIADYLQLRHHSTVELVDRARDNDLVERHTDPEDGRVVRLSLTAKGAERLASLAEAHLEELDRLIPGLTRLWDGDSDADG